MQKRETIWLAFWAAYKQPWSTCVKKEFLYSMGAAYRLL